MYDIRRYSLNREPRKIYRRRWKAIPLTPLQERIINELKEKGISIVHFNSFFPDSEFNGMRELAETYMRKAENQMKIKETEDGIRHKSKHGKFYLVRLLGDIPSFDISDKFMKFSLSNEILQIVCGYLKMFGRLVYVDLWYNVPTGGPATFSQRWHRDPDDKRLVKVFLYLRDVSETTGPFYFIPGTHNGGPFRKIFPQTLDVSRYPPDGAVEEKFAESQRQMCIGRAGTLIFCDTTGIHKGGHPSTEGRLLLNVVYTTNAGASRLGKLYSLSGLPAGSLSPAAEYAIGHLKT